MAIFYEMSMESRKVSAMIVVGGLVKRSGVNMWVSYDAFGFKSEFTMIIRVGCGSDY